MAAAAFVRRINKTFPRMRVLVADDHDINQDVLKDMLELMECEVDLASDGEETLEKCKEGHNYDILLLDVQMPVMDGYSVSRHIRAREREAGERLERLPIIAITANTLTGDRRQCFEAGMDAYMVKPVDGVTLQDMLEQYAFDDNSRE